MQTILSVTRAVSFLGKSLKQFMLKITDFMKKVMSHLKSQKKGMTKGKIISLLGASGESLVVYRKCIASIM